MASKDTTKTIHRSSVTGRIVKASYAKSHPNIIETERVRVPPRRSKGKQVAHELGGATLPSSSSAALARATTRNG